MQPEAARMVLVVEDNEVNRTLVLRQLRRLGYESAAVSDGLKAVEAVRAGGFGVVLMDYLMPTMDGLEATRRIRQEESVTGRRVPIIALTANTAPADRQACIDAGMDDFLSKPVAIEDLRDALSRWIAPSSPLPEPGSADPLPFSVIETYVAELPGRLGAIRESVERGDAAGLRLSAHTLRSTSALVGASALAQLCRELESLGRAGRQQEAAHHLEALESMGRAAHDALDRVSGQTG